MAKWGEALRQRLEHRPWYPWLIFVFVVLGAFIVNVDSTSVNVALPTIQEKFQIDTSTLQWVITAYLLMVTGLLPTIGMIGDMIGRKRIFMTGMIILALGSILCSLAANIYQLIGFRIFQAVGGAMVVANVSALVTDIFPQGQRGRPLGMVSSVVAVATVVGPLLGGFLTEWFDWRMIFWVNVPICIISFIGGVLFLPQRKQVKSDTKSFDRRGSVLFFFGMTFLLLYVSNGTSWGWTSQTGLLTLVTALLAWLLFIRTEGRHQNPLINLTFFKNPMFSMGTLSGYISYVLMLVPAIIMPLYLHNVLHISPMEIGLLMTPQAILMIVAAPVSGWISDKYSVHFPTFLGMGFISAALWVMAHFDTTTSYAWIIGAFSIFGLGFGLFNTANNLSIIESVPSNKAGLASGLVATMRNFGRVSGVAFAVLMLNLGLGVNASAELYYQATSLTFYGGFALAVLTMVFLFIRLKLLRENMHDKGISA